MPPADAGENLSFSPAASKEETLTLARQWLDARLALLKKAFLADNDASALLAGHSHAIDTLLAALFASRHQEKTAPIALVAIGGYGRAELFPYSDIDLLFLYRAGHAEQAGEIAEFILYILWDLGLKVGQAHRSVEEAVALAKTDATIQSSLLDARFIAGQKSLFDRFRTRFKKEVIGDSPLDFVEAKLAERKARHARFGDSRYVLEPNVKEGKGALRDLHTLWWLARYLYPVKRLKDLVALRLLSEEEYAAFDQARHFLCRVRTHLHYQAGRAEERLTFDRQHALAVVMGYNHPSVTRSIERFMRRYFSAVRTVGSLTRIFCALLEDEKKRKPRRSLASLWYMPWMLGAFKLDGERLNLRHDDAFAQQPSLMIDLFRVSQLHGLDIHPHALHLVTRHLHHIDDALRHDDKANAMFMDILFSPHEPETALRRMSEAGVLGRFIPDFGRVIGQTQFNMYHVYTVDEHTLVAIGILNAMEKGNLRKELPLSSEIIGRIKTRRVLYLALFCHDIAKGRGGDHSQLGEKIVLKLAARFGFSADEANTAAWLVRHHLLFSATAFKRDINDPKTVRDFVAHVQTPERLKLLLVLTAADIRAVGPAVWNAWKGGLLRDLYIRAEQCMGTGEASLPQHQAGPFKSELCKRLPGWEAADIETYLDQGNPNFWANFDPMRHAVIARMLREAQGSALPILVDTHHDYERAITEIILCLADRPGLFSQLAGAMALAGANIINAKIFTLKGGMAVDVFQVQDGGGGVFDRPDRLAKLSVYMEQALEGELDLDVAFARRTRRLATANPSALPIPGQVFIDNDASTICSVIELTGHDRAGFLYQVTKAIANLQLTIVTAHISTYGTQIADVFYVKDVFGMKITHETKLRQVQETLLRAIGVY